MSLGINREAVGDILVEDGRAVAFVSKDMVVHIRDNIAKVGNVGVEVTEGFSHPLPEQSTPVEFTDTVASARLDCVVAALVGCSRAKAVSLIEEGLVSVDSVCTEKTVRTVKAGEKITVRRAGKFMIDAIDDRTRKNRTQNRLQRIPLPARSY